jgi:antitoxin component of MazEF toxin-antitoxin module
MTKTLTPVGDGLALVIDRSILELLHIGKDTPLSLRVEGGALIVEPVDSSARARRVRAAAEGAMHAHDATLRKLAE